MRLSIRPNRPSPLDFLAPSKVDELLARPGDGLEPNMESRILPPTELDELDRIGDKAGRLRLSDLEGEAGSGTPNPEDTDTDDLDDAKADGSAGNELVELAAAWCSKSGPSGRPEPVECVGEGENGCGEDGVESRSRNTDPVGVGPSRPMVSTRSASLVSSFCSPRPRPRPMMFGTSTSAPGLSTRTSCFSSFAAAAGGNGPLWPRVWLFAFIMPASPKENLLPRSNRGRGV